MDNPYNYTGKRVVVTGAATGVGAALIELLAELDTEKVTVLDVKEPAGPHDVFLQTDLGNRSALDDAIARIDGPVHAIFNNAGVADTQPPSTVLAVNFLALRHLVHGLVDQMPDGGAVVNTASTAGGQWPARVELLARLLDIVEWDDMLAAAVDSLPTVSVAPYMFSKELVQYYTMRESRRLIRRGIRMNSVCPSPIDTPLLPDFRATMTDKVIDWNITETNGRLVTPREVATVLAFLGSDGAAYVNGVNLVVDAGFTAAMTTGQVDFAGLA
jgi:NAD(P)-dependent dehydrogenase (short-subunit alcohol dehydrogenase family)